MRFDLRHGDSREVLPLLDAASVDALVTDPPAGIGFMGKDWDDYRRSHNPADVGRANVFGRASRVAPEIGRAREGFKGAMQPIFEECLRILKPGAHGLVWALPRTSHWTATALEDAGFEIRDVGVHLFGTGFPKSLNIGDGRGTALKPAAEHWILVRKPLDGTVAANVAAHGTGALNIDACRIGYDGKTLDEVHAEAGSPGKHGTHSTARVYGIGWEERGAAIAFHPQGRWPANVTLDEESAALLDAQSGDLPAGVAYEPDGGNKQKMVYGEFGSLGRTLGYSDSGGGSRFFYVAKPDRGERDIGCEDLPAGVTNEETPPGTKGAGNPRCGANRAGRARNIHPTVKSVDLMRWLCRLVTPKGGLVLDPFMGSGSTGIACAREGMRFIGIERERAYFEIARRRIVGDAPLLNRIGQLQLEGPEKDDAA